MDTREGGSSAGPEGEVKDARGGDNRLRGHRSLMLPQGHHPFSPCVLPEKKGQGRMDGCVGGLGVAK